MSNLKRMFDNGKKHEQVQKDTPTVKKVRCANCGAEIVPYTAKKYKGLCAPCGSNPATAQERASRRLSPQQFEPDTIPVTSVKDYPIFENAEAGTSPKVNQENQESQGKGRFELWLRDTNKASDRDFLALLIARLGRENDWDMDRVEIVVGMASYGLYEIVPDEYRGGCRVIFTP